MRFMNSLAVSTLTLLLALPAAAQQKPVTVLYSNYVKAKDGMRREYEDAAKRHLEWHRKNRDQWPINVWEIISGERTGQYSYGIGHRQWHDFDTRGDLEQSDMADYYATADKFIDSLKVTYYIYVPELSRPAPAGTPQPLVEVMRYRVKMDSVSGFLAAVKKMHEAIQKSDAPVYYDLYQLYSGGEHPTYVFRFPRKNFADFEPLDPSLMAILEKAYGREEAESVMKSFSGSVVSVESEIAAARLDMSYTPEAK
jgi:hypothetical protein